jgi:hypothetical protein
MQEVEGGLWIVCGQEVTYLVGTIAGDDDELGNTTLAHGVNGTFQKGTFAYFEQALGLVIGERAQTLGHTRSKNYSKHKN